MTRAESLLGFCLLAVVTVPFPPFTETHDIAHFTSREVILDIDGSTRHVGNVSVPSKDNSSGKLLALEKEVLKALTINSGEVAFTHTVLPHHTINCLVRNGSLHRISNFYISGNVLLQNLFSNAKRGRNVFCGIRWTISGAPGILGTVSRFEQITCNNHDDIVSLYELNTTIPGKPQIKKLTDMCQATHTENYYGQTNEILIIIFVKDTIFHSEFSLKTNAAYKGDLEIHYQSNLSGKVLLIFTGKEKTEANSIV